MKETLVNQKSCQILIAHYIPAMLKQIGPSTFRIQRLNITIFRCIVKNLSENQYIFLMDFHLSVIFSYFYWSIISQKILFGNECLLLNRIQQHIRAQCGHRNEILRANLLGCWNLAARTQEDGRQRAREVNGQKHHYLLM